MLDKREHDHKKSIDAHLVDTSRLADSSYIISKKKPRPRDIILKDKRYFRIIQ